MSTRSSPIRPNSVGGLTARRRTIAWAHTVGRHLESARRSVGRYGAQAIMAGGVLVLELEHVGDSGHRVGICAADLNAVAASLAASLSRSRWSAAAGRAGSAGDERNVHRPAPGRRGRACPASARRCPARPVRPAGQASVASPTTTRPPRAPTRLPRHLDARINEICRRAARVLREGLP